MNKALQIRDAAIHVFNGIMSGCVEMSVAAGNAYRDLVDQFCEDNRDLVSPQQCEAAKSDFGYFFQLIDLAVVHWQDKERHEHP